MNKTYKISLLTLLIALAFTNVYAKQNIGTAKKKIKTSNNSNLRGLPCVEPSSRAELNVNNVRAGLLIAGDMWWDGNNARYEVPKVDPTSGQPSIHTIFAAAVWIGGLDASTGALKLAGQTYRQTGTDFWAGPLDENGQTEQAVCNKYNRFWEVNGAQIDLFKADLSDGVINDPIPASILEWPGQNNPNQPLSFGFGELAPYYDRNGDGTYNPVDGDIPIIGAQAPTSYDDANYADQMIWWVYNDNGDFHSESGAQAIGMQVSSLAFAYIAQNEVNDMTFIRHNLQNKGASVLDSTFMGQWVDPDLGNYGDDYVGCDTVAGMGYVYNGDANDEVAQSGYGTSIPLLGVDFFKGPKDANGVPLKMSRFLYYINVNTNPQGNPDGGQHFYNYLSGTWGDGLRWEWGGDGYQEGTYPVDYFFPSSPNQTAGPNVWSECSEANAPDDRRFLMSAGPFRLLPGANNDIVIGVVWVRPGNYPCPDLSSLQTADAKAQQLFDDNFKKPENPDAPRITSRVELNEELIFSWEGLLNNFNDTFNKIDQSLPNAAGTNKFYKFQGYQVYQVIDDRKIQEADLFNSNICKKVMECDLVDGVKDDIYNHLQGKTPNNMIYYTPVKAASLSNTGVVHSVNIKDDKFSTSANPKLINFKKYYYVVLAYAYNNFAQFDLSNAQNTQTAPIKLGDFSYITLIPHNTTSEYNGLTLNSEYGDGVEISRFEGRGNSGFFVDLTDESRNAIAMSPTNSLDILKYKAGFGPFKAYVFDPKKVQNANFTLYIKDTIDGDNNLNMAIAKWRLVATGASGTETFDMSKANLKITNEQLIDKYGIAIEALDVNEPFHSTSAGSANAAPNGFIGAQVEYKSGDKDWLTGLSNGGAGSILELLSEDAVKDPNNVYGNVLGGTWYPYRFTNCTPTTGGTNYTYFTPAWQSNALNCTNIKSNNRMDSIRNIDIVFTPDKTKWSKCIVVETAVGSVQTKSGKPKFDKSNHPSWLDPNLVDANGNPVYDATSTGWSWFPGYAVDVNTGTRLNIFFGENSHFAIDPNNPGIDGQYGDLGYDMLWNPNSASTLAGASASDLTKFVYGGFHNIYVSRTMYDGCAQIDVLNSSATASTRRTMFHALNWASIPYLATGYQSKSAKDGLVPGEAIVKLRVNAKFRTQFTGESDNAYHPVYKFSTSGMQPSKSQTSVAGTFMDEIAAVPNPYYGYSTYENKALQRLVKFINLPQKTQVTIFTMDGNIVRRFNTDFQNSSVDNNGNYTTFLDWDMLNEKGVPVSSGTYLIHFKSEGIGEKTIKWFGVMRPLDINSFPSN